MTTVLIGGRRNGKPAGLDPPGISHLVQSSRMAADVFQEGGLYAWCLICYLSWIGRGAKINMSQGLCSSVLFAFHIRLASLFLFYSILSQLYQYSILVLL